jgi:tetratricopeptide (TPR) repeat protein
VRVVAAVLAVAMLAVGAGALVARSAGERLPGETTTGDVELGVEDRLAQAQALVDEGKALEAIKLYDAILRDEPRQPAALAQRGWVLRSAGLVDEGLEYVERAIEVDPEYGEAHFFRGMILWRDKKDPAAAVEELRRFLALTPSSTDAATVEELLRQAEAEAAGATTVP